MEELNNMVNRLEAALKQKEDELNQKEDNDENSWRQLRNCQIPIQNFMDAVEKVSNNPLEKKRIIKNFTNEAEKIIKEIEKIK